MNISTEKAYSIAGVIDNMIVSKSGSLSVPFIVELPECYSLDIQDLEVRHNDFFRAFKLLPAKTFVHKQDVFVRKAYCMDNQSDTFIQRNEKKHFDGRMYLASKCIINFSSYDYETLSSAYVKNPFSFRQDLIKADKDKLSIFLEGVEGAITIIKNIPGTRIRPMKTNEIKHYLFDFVNGFHADNGMRDIRFNEKIEIGSKRGSFFAVCHENYLPDQLNVFVKDDSLEASNTSLYMAMTERLGVHLPCTHIVNQIWKFEGSKLKEDLNKRVTVFGQHRNFGMEIKLKHKQLAEYEQEILEEQNLLCRSHFNIMLLEDDHSLLEKCEEEVKEIFRTGDFKYYVPTYEGLFQIYTANVLGREHKIDKSYLFFTDLHASLCLSPNYSTFRDDEKGVLFNDRIFQMPLRKDIWNAEKKRIPARNAIVVASTGGGKSVLSLNIVQQLIEQEYKVIVVEFGKSFYQLGQLYKDRTLHVDYNGSEPLGINPFLIYEKEPGNEKVKTLVNLVLKFMRSIELQSDTVQVVSLTKIIRDYYERVKTGHSFPDFYNYVKENKEDILERLNILPEYFNINHFIHVGSEFIEGGFYENVCKPSGLEHQMKDKNFIIFELTKIKKDPFLVSVIMQILFDTIENKILSDRSTRGMLVFDEYAETQALTDMFTGDDIHSTVAFCYQKLRKENGAVMTIIQSPAQLPDNNYTKGMIGNTQILYVLPTTETVYDQVIEAFHVKNQSHINLMKSIKNGFSAKKPYSEVFIRFIDLYATAVRLELSRQKYLAFQTEGEVWSRLQAMNKKNDDMEKTISEYIELQEKEKEVLYEA